DIDDGKTGCAQSLGHREHKPTAVRTAPTFVGIGKVPADGAQRGGPGDAVADRMEQDVAVRVTKQPLVEWNVHAADHELATRDKRVDVEALAYSKTHSNASAFQNQFRQRQILRICHLQVG